MWDLFEIEETFDSEIAIKIIATITITIKITTSITTVIHNALLLLFICEILYIKNICSKSDI